MDVKSQLQALTRHKNVGVSSDGQVGDLRMSRLGQLFTADWKTSLVLGGYAFNVTVGDLANAGGDVALVTGGGNGTVVDSDQPELIVGVTAGYVMIPLFFQCALSADLDADAEVANIALFADTTQAPPTSVTGVTETPISLVGTGVHTSVARAYSAVTADITDPVCSIMLGFKNIRAADAGSAASEQVYGIDYTYDPSVPVILRGPCSVVACVGGTAAVTTAMTFHWAELPEGYFYP